MEQQAMSTESKDKIRRILRQAKDSLPAVPSQRDEELYMAYVGHVSRSHFQNFTPLDFDYFCFLCTLIEANSPNRD